MRIAVTGHRPDKLGGYDRNTPTRAHLRHAFRTLLLSLVADAWCRGDRHVEVITGGALGIDQDFAGVAVRAGVPYALYVPFPGQERLWPAEAQRTYAELVKRASRVVLCADSAPSGHGDAGRLLLARNKRMVDDADVVVAAWDGSTGGTSHCVRYATSRGRRVYNLMSDMMSRRGEWEMQARRAAKDGVWCG